MAKRKCGNCGAPLPRDQFVCGYCATDWTPDSENFGVQPEIRPEPAPTPIGPGRPPAPKKTGQPFWQQASTQIAVFAILTLLCCPPAALVYAWVGTSWQRRSKIIWTIVLTAPLALLGLLMYVDTAIYTIHGDFEKVDPSVPAAAQRQVQPLDPGTVYAALAALADQPPPARELVWREAYAGKWVRWEGKVAKTNIYTSMPSELDLDIDQSALFTVTVYFDPEQNQRLKELAVGQDIAISGRLWGYGYLFDDLYLADGAIVASDDTAPDPAPIPAD